MYCVKCGVKLSEGQRICPLCETKVYHPDFLKIDNSTFPRKEFASEAINRTGLLFVITVITLLPMLLPLIMEWVLTDVIVWSGYVTGGVLLAYILAVLPCWFRHPTPAVFVPLDFAAILLYVLFINLQNGGGWFLSFAFPVVGALGVIVTAASVLLYYLKRGKLYVWGGTLIALGLWTVLIEGMVFITFDVKSAVSWSLCTLIALTVLGMLLLLIAIVKPWKESLRKIFYIG